MKFIQVIILFILFIYQSECEKRFLKIDNCTANSKVAKIDLCEISDGKLSANFDIIKPLDEFLIEFCFFRSINKVFNQLGKCQFMNHCDFMSAQKQSDLSPMLRKFVSFWKFAGIEGVKISCPVIGNITFNKLDISNNFMSFIPKGIMKLVTKTYNNQDGMIFILSAVFVIN
ncbi:hypothetical protein ACKWTF_014290 [Chironomus riparius]